jgi:hypothetical protein
MKVKPKEVFVNLPVVLLFNNEDDIPELCSNFNTFLHGKVKLKYETLGALNGQFVGLFYLQRNDESQQLRDEFVRLIEEEEIIKHNQKTYFATLTGEEKQGELLCSCGHELHLAACPAETNNGYSCQCKKHEAIVFHIMEK